VERKRRSPEEKIKRENGYANTCRRFLAQLYVSICMSTF